MKLTPQQTQDVITHARNLSLTSPAQRVEDFISGILKLNLHQQAQYFPDPDPKGFLAIATSYLTASRELVLRDVCRIPSFAVFDDRGTPNIAGLSTYLAHQGYDARFLGRLAHNEVIRSALRALERGHYLEGLAAAILNQHLDRGEATQSSADEGVDAIGWKELLMINLAFSDGSITGSQIFPGQNVLILASSKAVIGAGRGKPRLLDVAHVRELVGTWAIQRSPIGKWNELGIQMLTPLQMILVTTYRISVNAKKQCRMLGVQVWSIPELIYLICKWAPDDVFDVANGYAFSAANFRSWWHERHQKRRIAA